MSLLGILKSLLNLFCGPPSSQQQEQQQQYPQAPQQQYPQAPQQQYPQAPQQQYPQAPQQQYPHKPQGQYPHKPQEHKPYSSPPHKPLSHRPQAYQDQNQINQNNEHYTSLRARANEQGDEMAKCFEQSHQAYARGDGARAKELSNKGKEHQRNMERLNKEACDWIFIENNKDSKPGEIDLHGLYVKEAIARTDEALEQAKANGQSQLHLIVGKGLHSRGAAKIKPAIEELMQKHQLAAELDPDNAGVLIVQINGRAGDRGVGPDEISRRIDRDNESCIIM